MKLRIKEVCKQKGITQKELAAKIGTSEVTLSRAANGNTSLPLLASIASALGVSVSELFEKPAKGVINCPYCGKEIAVEAAKLENGEASSPE